MSFTLNIFIRLAYLFLIHYLDFCLLILKKIWCVLYNSLSLFCCLSFFLIVNWLSDVFHYLPKKTLLLRTVCLCFTFCFLRKPWQKADLKKNIFFCKNFCHSWFLIIYLVLKGFLYKKRLPDPKKKKYRFGWFQKSEGPKQYNLAQSGPGSVLTLGHWLKLLKLRIRF